MIRALLCSVALVVGGCVSVPSAPVYRMDVRGQVRTPAPITRPAFISVRLYALTEGQLRLIAQARYRVTALPLHFAFRLTPVQVAGERLLLRSELTWFENGPVQSRSWQPAVLGNNINVRLEQLPCYPECTVLVAPEYL
ncbi:YscW family type III secretion system pilotin [Pseudomonas koreensis]|uniref:YscW family type III secretion system pilotin n=1 Tax=Pseudomonas koreensis TaxID=198620 RepID=UPI001B33A7C7|nr:YscW family type III secretion system pilotin [Pseudomonas koreensis]MBP3996490.1 YscW family type III secretion system pilotin [Pseudomonas koreensis]